MTSIMNYLLTAFLAGAGFAAIYAPLSFAIRYWQRTHDQQQENTQGAKGTVEKAPAGLDPEQARQLFTRLHDVAIQLTGDVAKHNESMEAVNRQLKELDPTDGEKTVEIVLEALDRITHSNDELAAQLNSAKSTIEEQADLMEAQLADALTDPLTQIANRRALDHELVRRLTEWNRQRTPLSLVMMDVDHFKKFNDTHGHQAGDEVLRVVAKTLSENMRDMDLVARYGGEEFSVVLPATNLNDAKTAAERVRTSVEAAKIEFEGTTLQVTTSVGLAQIDAGDDAEALFKRADEALYASKEAGRNCSHFHNGTTCELIGDRKTPVEQLESHEVSNDQTTEQTAKPPASNGVAPDPSKDATGSDEHTDPMTGLPNRLALTKELHRRLAEWERLKVPLSIITLELDDLDEIEKLGDKATDFVLDVIARLSSAVSRDMDLVARSGDNQFSIMLPSCDLANAVTPAERIRKAVASCDKLKHQGESVRFSVSSGVAEASEDDDADGLITRAEFAMRRASASGQNCTFVHNGTTSEPAESASLV